MTIYFFLPLPTNFKIFVNNIMNEHFNPEIYRSVREYNLKSDIYPTQKLTELYQAKEEKIIREKLYDNIPAYPSNTSPFVKPK